MAHHPIVPIAQILAQVNNRPETLDVVFTAADRVRCDGTGGALGHPRVFYTIGEKGFAECGYCDRVFVYDPDRAGGKSA